MALKAGGLFAREYRIVRPLGEGAMGTLYVAEQVSTGAQRALKLLNVDLLQDARMRERFTQEARVGSLIESDHVVQVITAGVDEETAIPYLVMELLKGEDLARHIQQRGPIPRVEVTLIVEQLCHALAAAHAVGVVHRDLKPDNIFLSSSRRAGVPFTVKVLDFGIAKVLAEARAATTAAIGTPLFMAPEQASAGDLIGAHTDVWALGLIVYRLLTGNFFWRAAKGNASIIALMREVTYDPVPSATLRAAESQAAHLLPPGFDEWFALCVDRNPNARFATAGAAWSSLEPILRDGATINAVKWQSASYPILSPALGMPVAKAASSVGGLDITHDIASILIKTSEPDGDEEDDNGPQTIVGAEIPPKFSAHSTSASRPNLPRVSAGASASATLDPARLHERYEAYVRAGDTERSACIAGMLVFAGKADRRERAHHEERMRRTPRFRAPLGEMKRKALLGHPARDANLDAIASAITPAARRMRVTDMQRSGSFPTVGRGKLEDPRTTATTFGKTFFGVTRVLSLQAPLLYVDADKPGRLTALPIDPPTSVAGAGMMTGIDRRELAFHVAEHAMLYRPGDYLRVLCDDIDAIEVLFCAAIGLVVDDLPVPASLLATLATTRASLEAFMHADERAALTIAVEQWSKSRAFLDVPTYVHLSALEGARAGLLASDDVTTAARLVTVGNQAEEGFSVTDRLEDLLVFAVSEPYFMARETCGLTEG